MGYRQRIAIAYEIAPLRGGKREKRALRQVCGAGVPPAVLCPNLLGSRDGRTTIVPRLGGEPEKS